MSYQSAQDPEENLPEWLKALRKRQSGAVEPESAVSGEAQSDPSPASSESASPDTEPGWLAEIRQRYHQREETSDDDERALSDTQPTAPLKPLEKRRLPEPEIEPEPEFSEPEFSEPEEVVPAEPAIPQWLSDVTDEPKAEAAPEPEEVEEDLPLIQTRAFPGSDEEDLSPAELPSWLQAIRPSSSTLYPDEDMRSQQMLPGGEETVGPLAGLSGVLPAEPEIAKIGRAPVFSNRLLVTDSQAGHAAAFSRLLANEGQPAEDSRNRAARPTRVLSSVIAVGLLFATLIPLLTGTQAAARPQLDMYPEAAEIFNAIDVLPANAPVLIAFEVQPAFYGEIKPAAKAVLNHLLDKQAQLIFISTQPTGPALAERLLQEQLAAQPRVATGDYMSLGYLSGGMAALRSFTSDPRAATLSSLAALQNPWQTTTLSGIQQLNDFALVIVISSDSEDARAWLEQSSGQIEQGMFMISSAQGAPLLRPYLQNNPPVLRGLLSGLTGGAYYEQLRAQNDLGRSYWDAYSYGLGAMVILILLGGLYGKLIHLRPTAEEKQNAN
jgi:hypothetical protein